MCKNFFVIMLIILNTACAVSSTSKKLPEVSNKNTGKEVYQQIVEKNMPTKNIAEKAEEKVIDHTTVIYQPTIESKPVLTDYENKKVESINLNNSKSVFLEIKQEQNLVKLILNNPQGKLITAVRTWLSFPPHTAKITNLNINNTIFALAAPDEYKVDVNNGLIKIGVSTINGTRSTVVQLASFNITNLSKYGVPINCYDQSEKTDSHCAVWGEEKGNMLSVVNGIIIE